MAVMEETPGYTDERPVSGLDGQAVRQFIRQVPKCANRGTISEHSSTMAVAQEENKGKARSLRKA
jgi:hypothetical protein